MNCPYNQQDSYTWECDLQLHKVRWYHKYSDMDLHISSLHKSDFFDNQSLRYILAYKLHRGLRDILLNMYILRYCILR